MVSKIKEVIADYKLLLQNVPALVTVIFVLVTCVMNLAAGKIILHLGPVALTGGFLASFVPFLCMDSVTKHFGARASIMLNILSAAGNLFVVVFLGIVAAIPTPGEDYTAFNSVNGAVWYIALSSTVAFVLSGVVNSLLNAAVGKLFKKNPDSPIAFYIRAYVSTFVGQSIDNFIFLAGVYALFSPMFGGFSLPISTCIVTGILGGGIELALEVVFSPVGYKVAKSWKETNVGAEYRELHGIE